MASELIARIQGGNVRVVSSKEVVELQGYADEHNMLGDAGGNDAEPVIPRYFCY